MKAVTTAGGVYENIEFYGLAGARVMDPKKDCIKGRVAYFKVRNKAKYYYEKNSIVDVERKVRVKDGRAYVKIEGITLDITPSLRGLEFTDAVLNYV